MKIDPTFCLKQDCLTISAFDKNGQLVCERICTEYDQTWCDADQCETCDHYDDVPKSCPWYMEQLVARQES